MFFGVKIFGLFITGCSSTRVMSGAFSPLAGYGKVQVWVTVELLVQEVSRSKASLRVEIRIG